MSRRYVPDPAALTTALAGRVDVLENEHRQTRTDVTAIGRGLATLTAQIRSYTATATLIGLASGDPDDALDDGDVLDADGEPSEQPDWMSIDDPGTAADWLTVLAEWLDTVGAHQGLTPIEACWPLHPDVVALLLALQCERNAAYVSALTKFPRSERVVIT